MTNPRVVGGLLPIIVLLAAAGRATSAEPVDKASAQAKQLVSHGLHLFENGAYTAALTEFERAYELVPSRLVLYRTALVYVAMDKPVDAVETLDELLSAEGPLDADYLERAKAAKEEQQRHIGELDVKVNVPATIEIDGASAGNAPLKEPLKVAAGDHVVCVVAPGHAPARRSVTMDVELEPAEGKLAHVTVYSPVPGFDVRVDDVLVGKTPFAAPVIVLPGKRVFEMRRAGYQSTQRTVELGDGIYSTLAFNPAEDKTPGTPRGRLRLTACDGAIAVTIDGQGRDAYQAPIELPAGPHDLKVERIGYEPIERMVTIPAGDETEVKLSLRPTAQTRRGVETQTHSRRNWAIAALVTGAAVAGGATGLAIWSNGKLPGAEDKLTLVKKDATPGGDGQCDPNRKLNDLQTQLCGDLLSHAQSDIDKYHNLRLEGFIGIGIGAALVATGLTLLLTQPDTGADDAGPPLVGTLRPVLFAGPDGAGLWLRGRF
jgi:hypothetical protein